MVPSHKTVTQYHNQDTNINSQDKEHFNQHEDSSGLHLWTYHLLCLLQPILNSWQSLIYFSNFIEMLYKWNNTVCDLLILFSLNMILWRFIQVVAYINSLFLFVAQ